MSDGTLNEVQMGTVNQQLTSDDWKKQIEDEALDRAIEEYEDRCSTNTDEAVEDQWGYNPADYQPRDEVTSKDPDRPLSISQEDSTSEEGDNMDDFEQDQNEVMGPEMNTAAFGDGSDPGNTEDDHSVTPLQARQKLTLEIRRSARLLCRNGKNTTANNTELAGKVRALECAPTPRTIADSHSPMGSIIIADLPDHADIKVLATSSGFIYSPKDADIYKMIAEEVAGEESMEDVPPSQC